MSRSGEKAVRRARREMLPGWIAFFSLPFLVFLTAPLMILGLGLFPPGSYSCEAFGLSYTGSPLAPEALAISAVLFLHGVAAFGLVTGRAWGIAAGIAAGTVGLTIALGVGACVPVDPRMEPFLQVPFLIWLFRSRDRWANPGSGSMQQLSRPAAG